MSAARLRKLDCYADLQDEARSKGFRTTVLTLEVGSRGIPDVNGFKSLKELLGMSSKVCSSNVLPGPLRAHLPSGQNGIVCSKCSSSCFVVVV